MSSAWTSGLVPQLRPAAEWLVTAGTRYDPQMRVTSVRRSRSEQSRLWRRYQAGQSLYPAAPPGSSKHELGVAFDVNGRPEVLAWMGRVWESWGGRWGGRFNDPIHFEV